ncbi:MAG: hypothetical protein PHE36_13855 [Novosphingobium sp.]|nr:hypothetical protein [Novosphingobium sp.]
MCKRSLSPSLSKVTVLGSLSLAVTACSPGDAEAPPAQSGGERIACALGGAAQFATDCVVERNREEGALFLTVRHPDGGFRRFEVMTDGTGLAAADGMEQAETRLSGDTLEVAVASDRYRFPATAKDHADKP